MSEPFTDGQLATKAAAIDSALAGIDALVLDYLDALNQNNAWWRTSQRKTGQGNVLPGHVVWSKGQNLVTAAFVNTNPKLAKVLGLRLNQGASATLADNHS